MFLQEFSLFLAKSVTILLVVFIIVSIIAAAAQKGKDQAKGQIKLKKLNQHYQDLKKRLRTEVLEKVELKKIIKAEKKAEKQQKKQSKEISKPTIFVITFKGDIKASAVSTLREEITAILTIAKKDDEIVVCLESPGGMVHAYGLAASQLKRIRDHGCKLTVIVDKVAASGGYLMAAVAHRIIAAPFAVIGSIGVIAQLPNFHRYLKNKNIDFEQLTAGQYKRTLTMFGENTSKAREKFQEELDETHELFKGFIKECRPQLDLEKIATGEHWYGQKAHELNLIDELQTSDDYLLKASDKANLYQVHYHMKKALPEKIASTAQLTINKLFSAWQQQTHEEQSLR